MSDDNGKQNFWVEMLSDEKEKQISSTSRPSDLTSKLQLARASSGE